MPGNSDKDIQKESDSEESLMTFVDMYPVFQ